MHHDGSTVDAGAVIRDRLGMYRFGCSHEIKALAAMFTSSELDAIGAATWRRHGWIVVAAGAELVLVRQRLLRPTQFERLRWDDMTDGRVESGALRLTFGEAGVVRLSASAPELLRFRAAAGRFAPPRLPWSSRPHRSLGRRPAGS